MTKQTSMRFYESICDNLVEPRCLLSHQLSLKKERIVTYYFCDYYYIDFFFLDIVCHNVV